MFVKTVLDICFRAQSAYPFRHNAAISSLCRVYGLGLRGCSLLLFKVKMQLLHFTMTNVVAIRRAFLKGPPEASLHFA